MAGGSAHHLAQRRHRRAEHAGRGLPCARVRLRDFRWHRRDRRPGRDGAVIGDLPWHRRDRRPGRDGAVIGDLPWHRRDRRLGRGGAVRGWARPGGGRARIRTGCGWFGHGVFPWQAGSAAASLAAAGWRPAGTLRRRTGRRAAATPAPSRAGVSCRRPRPRAAAIALAVRQAPAGARELSRLRRPCRCCVTGWPAAAPGRFRAGRRAASASLAFIVSPPLPGHDPGPAASIRHRHSRPGRGIVSLMGTSDRVDRADAHELLR